MKKLLAIDYGEAKIGLAITDETGRIALPYQVIENKGFVFVLSYLKDVCEEEMIEEIIVGRPIGLEGQETQQTKKTDEFIDKLKNNLEVSIETEDERLTSKAAQTLLGSSRRYGPGEGDHAVAAMIILRDWLERNT